MDENRLKGLMGLCLRAGQAVFGEEGCRSAIRNGSCGVLLLDRGISEGSGKKYIRVRVCDNGPGVDEDDLPLITEKYFRGKAAKNQSGYGIGMHLVKSYMEKMGGGMEYYNDNGFVVELLLKKV